MRSSGRRALAERLAMDLRRHDVAFSPVRPSVARRSASPIEGAAKAGCPPPPQPPVRCDMATRRAITERSQFLRGAVLRTEQMWSPDAFGAERRTRHRHAADKNMFERGGAVAGESRGQIWTGNSL